MASLEKLIPWLCLQVKSLQWYLENSADILNLWISTSWCGHLCFWFTEIFFSGGQIFQFWRSTDHSFRRGTVSFPSRMLPLRVGVPVAYEIRKIQGSTSHSKLKAMLVQMIQRSASESRSVDCHRQFINSSNMYLDLKNHGLDEFQDDSDSGKCIPGNRNVLADSLSG